jgi:hypothetical protein
LKGGYHHASTGPSKAELQNVEIIRRRVFYSRCLDHWFFGVQPVSHHHVGVLQPDRLQQFQTPKFVGFENYSALFSG